MERKKIPLPTLRRIPRYLRVAEELFEQKVLNISSAELARHLGFTASQVRQDFSALREIYGVTVCGQQGCGYRTEVLRNTMSQILHLEQEKSCIAIGMDYLFGALMQHMEFALCGVVIEAVFVDEEETASVIQISQNRIPVIKLQKLDEFCKKNRPRMAILACKPDEAQVYADKLAELGVEGIWNLTSTDIIAPDKVEVEDMNIYDSLMTLGARLSSMEG